MLNKRRQITAFPDMDSGFVNALLKDVAISGRRATKCEDLNWNSTRT